MADRDFEPLVPAIRYDGRVLCAVCGAPDTGSSHDWCIRSSRLVCDRCCHVTLLSSLSDLTSGDDDRCVTCERGREWFTGQVLGHTTAGWDAC